MPSPENVAIATAIAEALDDGLNIDEPIEVTIRGDRTGLVMWQTPPATPGAPAGHHSATAGAVVTMPRRAAIRLAVLGWIDDGTRDALPAATAVEELDDLEALEAPAEGLAAFLPAAATTPDVDVAALSAADAIATVNQSPELAAAILAAEEARPTSKQRTSVLEAARTVIDATA